MSASPKIDFHCHSHFSDGSLPPSALLNLASEQGVEQLSITDHDTVNAYSHELTSEAKALGIMLVAGCEISCQWQGRNIHVVGLNLNICESNFAEAMVKQAQARAQRAEKITQVLKKLGFQLELEQIQALAGDGIIGRPHFAQYLIQTDQVASSAAAFKQVLGSGKPGDIKANWPSLEVAVDWINGAGGVAVLAHPLKYKMTLTKLRRLLEEFVSSGGEGMEVLSGYQEPSQTKTLADLARRYQLYASAGSDFHQPGQPWAALGRVSKVPESCNPVWKLWS